MKLMSTMLSQCILSWNLVFPVRSIYIFCYKRNLYSVQKTNMKTLVIICLMVSVFTFSEACSCIGGHPQRQFCDADFGRYLIVFFVFFFGVFLGFFLWFTCGSTPIKYLTDPWSIIFLLLKFWLKSKLLF